MSTTTPSPRPPRTTVNYGWPIAGDADPADYVTYTGNLADAIDATLRNGGGVPVLTPAQLSQAPYNAPTDGQIVDVVVYYDAVQVVMWRLRWYANITADQHKWCYVGGTPLEAYDNTAANGFLNQWNALFGGPTIVLPRPGVYRIEAKCEVGGVAGNPLRAYLNVDRAGTPLTGVFTAAASGQVDIPAFPNGGYNIMLTAGTTQPLPVDTIRMIFYPQTYNAATINRWLRIWPMRVS